MTTKFLISMAVAASLIASVANATSALSREGDMQMSIRGSALTKNAESTNTDFKKTGWGAEIEAKYFVTNNLASVVGVAWHHRVPSDTITPATAHYTKADYFPIKIGAQLHAMNPSEKVSIYGGGGYTYVITNFTWNPDPLIVAEKTKKNQHGAYVQVGIDAKVDDSIALNIDVQKIFSLRDIQYKLGGGPTAVTTSHEPLIISAGVTFSLSN